MPSRKPGKRSELAAWLDRTRPRLVGEKEFAELQRDLAPVSESYLRKLLRESGVPLSATVEGVRQSNLDELEASLLAMLREYETGNTAVRRLVITAKDHARWAARRKPGEKEEMLLWLMTWLENPPVFPEWVKLRRRGAG